MCTQDIKDQQVDLINMTTFSEHNPDESSLLVLPCSHVFTVESLDGAVEIQKVYKKNNNGQWIGIIPLDEIPEETSEVMKCPNCRKPISGIRRYGRILNILLLRQIKQKYLVQIQEKVALYNNEKDKFTEQIQKLTSQETRPKNEIAKLWKKLNKMINDIINLCKDCKENAPTLKLYNVDQARAQKFKLDPPKLIPPHAQPLMSLLHIQLKAHVCQLQFFFAIYGKRRNLQKKNITLTFLYLLSSS